MKTSLLRKQYEFYVAHEAELLEQYNGTHLVIDDSLHVYSFKEARDAYRYGAQNFGGGHFLLQECKPGVLNVVHQINCYI